MTTIFENMQMYLTFEVPATILFVHGRSDIVTLNY